MNPGTVLATALGGSVCAPCGYFYPDDVPICKECGLATIRAIPPREPVPRIVIRVLLKLPYKNELTPAPGRHAWLRFIKVKKDWARAVPKALPHQLAKGPRSVLITRVMGPKERRFDTANVYFAAAAILDVIKSAGYLVNDSDVHCELLRPEQRRARPGEAFPSVILELRDVETTAPRAVPT
jgi:hypothetical protein